MAGFTASDPRLGSQLFLGALERTSAFDWLEVDCTGLASQLLRTLGVGSRASDFFGGFGLASQLVLLLDLGAMFCAGLEMGSSVMITGWSWGSMLCKLVIIDLGSESASIWFSVF